MEELSFAKEVLDFTKTFIALFFGAGFAFIGWLVGRREYKKGSFRGRIEIIGVEPTPEGLDFHTYGPQMDLGEVVSLGRLKELIVKATKKVGDDDLLRLTHPRDHRRMMEIIEDWLTGNDWRANAAALKGRPVNEDRIGFAPTFYHEEDDDAMIRVYVFDPEWMSKMRDPVFAQSQKARKKRFAYRIPLLQRIAGEESTERSRSGGTSVVWHTIIKTARSDVQEANRNVA